MVTTGGCEPTAPPSCGVEEEEALPLRGDSADGIETPEEYEESEFEATERDPNGPIVYNTGGEDGDRAAVVGTHALEEDDARAVAPDFPNAVE